MAVILGNESLGDLQGDEVVDLVAMNLIEPRSHYTVQVEFLNDEGDVFSSSEPISFQTGDHGLVAWYRFEGVFHLPLPDPMGMLNHATLPQTADLAIHKVQDWINVAPQSLAGPVFGLNSVVAADPNNLDDLTATGTYAIGPTSVPNAPHGLTVEALIQINSLDPITVQDSNGDPILDNQGDEVKVARDVPFLIAKDGQFALGFVRDDPGDINSPFKWQAILGFAPNCGDDFSTVFDVNNTLEKYRANPTVEPGIHHITLTYGPKRNFPNKGIVKFYHNGDLIPSQDNEVIPIKSLNSNCLGNIIFNGLKEMNNDLTQNFFDGLLDEISVYNRKLSDAEIKNSYLRLLEQPPVNQ